MPSLKVGVKWFAQKAETRRNTNKNRRNRRNRRNRQKQHNRERLFVIISHYLKDANKEALPIQIIINNNIIYI